MLKYNLFNGGQIAGLDQFPLTKSGKFRIEVVALQNALNIKADGIFGKQTLKAVQKHYPGATSVSKSMYDNIRGKAYSGMTFTSDKKKFVEAIIVGDQASFTKAVDCANMVRVAQVNGKMSSEDANRILNGLDVVLTSYRNRQAYLQSQGYSSKIEDYDTSIQTIWGKLKSWGGIQAIPIPIALAWAFVATLALLAIYGIYAFFSNDGHGTYSKMTKDELDAAYPALKELTDNQKEAVTDAINQEKETAVTESKSNTPMLEKTEGDSFGDMAGMVKIMIFAAIVIPMMKNIKF